MNHDGTQLLQIELYTAKYNFVYWSGEVSNLQRFSPSHAQFFLKGGFGEEEFIDLPHCPSNLGLRDGHDVVVAALVNPLTVSIPHQGSSSVILGNQKFLYTALHNRTLRLNWSMDDGLLHALRQLDPQVARQLVMNDDSPRRAVDHGLTPEQLLERRSRRSPSSAPVSLPFAPAKVATDTHTGSPWSGVEARFDSEALLRYRCGTEQAWAELLLSHCVNALWGLQESPSKGGW